jgi:hypothetical protein
MEVTEGSVFVLRKATKIIGQAIRVQPKSQIPTKKIARIGDTTKKVSYQPTESSVNIEIYTEFDPDQLAAVLGGTQKPGSGGWVGTEQLVLNPTITAYDLILDQYDGALGTGDTLVGTWTMKNFKPTSLDLNVQSDNPATITINGEMENFYLVPHAGLGA